MSWAGSTRAKRLPPGWKKLRLTILKRDQFTCTRRVDGKRCLMPATEVDHIIPGDNHAPSNLASLCAHHHREKTQREASSARHRYSAKRPPEQHPGLTPRQGPPPPPT